MTWNPGVAYHTGLVVYDLFIYIYIYMYIYVYDFICCYYLYIIMYMQHTRSLPEASIKVDKDSIRTTSYMLAAIDAIYNTKLQLHALVSWAFHTELVGMHRQCKDIPRWFGSTLLIPTGMGRQRKCIVVGGLPYRTGWCTGNACASLTSWGYLLGCMECTGNANACPSKLCLPCWAG